MDSRDVTKVEQTKTFLNGAVRDFSVDHSSIIKEDILDIEQNLIVKTNIK